MTGWRNKSKEIADECLRRLYREAKPPLDYDKAKKAGYTLNSFWFMNHVLRDDRQEEIILEVLEKYKVPKNVATKEAHKLMLMFGPKGEV